MRLHAAQEVWTASGSDPLARWSACKAAQRVFDASLRAYVMELPSSLGSAARPAMSGACGCCVATRSRAAL
jgi:hypothetical protein